MAMDRISGAAGPPGSGRSVAGQEALRRLSARQAPEADQSAVTIEIRFPAPQGPAVRQAKVSLAQARIAAGFYDLPEVRHGVVENILCAFGH